uniref:Sulfatase N-terminal domain-containing protein n=1 Tax=Lotharella oceanica TaxID=641309 RepID=A0A7S2XH33_9EUKA|mmetsp:Transcript_7236/g.14200  ORF Transcript_7236/g.14200 Transcript_7236/m.14200 type:complete len:295 (+) Transcript_7236:429-1313(+)
MVNYLDEAIGRVVDLLKARGMYNNTLIAFSSDNGGPVYQNGTSGANNYPLRGGKASNWEGGVRVNAWVSGGLVPEAMRSRALSGLSTAWDWWATFAAVGGIEDASDHKARAAGLPPVDSVNLWPYWNGSAPASPRKAIALGSCVSSGHPRGFDQWCTNANDRTTVGGVIVDMGSERGGGLWKLIREEELAMNGWQGVSFPNSTTSHFELYRDRSCGSSQGTGTGCLFRVDDDPNERNNLAAAKPDVVEALAKVLDEAQATSRPPAANSMRSSVALLLRSMAGTGGPSSNETSQG